jgi:RimJ/RimL family protein N-acetyltransferase
MTIPAEQIRLTEKPIIETDIPGMVVEGISEVELPDVKALFNKNIEHSAGGGVASDEFLYNQVVEDVTKGKGTTDQRFGIRLGNKLVGYIGAVPKGNLVEPDLIELSYFVDKDYIRKGIAKAAVGAVVKHEENKDKTVFAVVDSTNKGSIKVLEGLGLHESHVDRDMRTVMAKRALVSDEILEQFGML